MAGEATNQGAPQPAAEDYRQLRLARQAVAGEDPRVDRRLVHRSIAAWGSLPEASATLTPSVPLRRSVQRDMVICLDCGWKGKMLRRHLTTRHGLSAEDYLKRWGLPGDHPLTAPSYSAQRSTLAKQLGLGRGRRAASGRGRRPRGS